MITRDVRPTVAMIAVALAVVATSCGDGDRPDDGLEPPAVFISTPAADEIVRDASFEITGGFSGSVTTIDVSIDGIAMGPARRSDEPDDWRVPADDVNVAPGLHEISVFADGEDGTDTARHWIFYEPDTSVTFEIRILPESAAYQTDVFTVDDPRLHLFGPTDGISVNLTADAPSELRASVNQRLTTRSLASVDLDVRDRIPGVYPVVVQGVSDAGFVREATHVVTLTGPPATSEPTTTVAAPTSTAATTGTRLATWSDDFEGPDLWTATVAGSTNGSQGTAEVASGGNPGGLRRMTHELPGTGDGENNPSQISVLHTFGGGVWDPAIDGPISSIDYSEDQIEFEPPFEGAAIGALFAIIQDGTTYTATINEANAFSNTTWQTTRVTGLVPADFSPAPGPDFSENGEPMSFGYVRANTSRSTNGIVTQHGIDNWTVELFGA